MLARSSPRPLVPADLDPGRSLCRALTCLALSRLDPARDVMAIAARNWPQDRQTHLQLRGALAPTATTASTLTPSIVASFVSGLATQSAAAALIDRGLKIDLSGAVSATLPRAQTNPAPGWIAEGSPIPVAQPALTAATIGPM